MDKPIIFLDCDGCLAAQGKIWYSQAHVDKEQRLGVHKVISDHDSWAIDHFKEHAHIVIISGDERINRAWAERRGVPFIFTCAAGFHQDKWEFLVDYMVENHYDRIGAHVKGTYYYLGDAMPDYKCLVNAKTAFVPYDASRFLISKLQHSNRYFKHLSVSSGNGTFEEMAWRLEHEGVLPSV